MTSRDSLNDYENSLVVLKSSLQNREETERQASFVAGASIVSAAFDKFRYCLECNGVADYLLYGQYIKAKSVDFWIYLNSTTEEIIDPVVGNDIDVNAGTLQYTDWDDAFVDGVNTNTIGASAWHHVAITSTTDVTLASGFNIGKGSVKVANMRWWNIDLDITMIGQIYNGTVLSYPNDLVSLYDLPDVNDKIASNNGTNYGADIVQGRNGGNAYDFLSANTDYVDFGEVTDFQFTDATDFSVMFWINPDKAQADTTSVVYGNGIWDVNNHWGSQLVSPGNVLATIEFQLNNGATATQLSASIQPATWSCFLFAYQGSTKAMRLYRDGLLVDSDTYGDTGNFYTGGENTIIGRADSSGGRKYLDGMVDLVGVFDTYLTASQAMAIYQRTSRGLLI